MKKLIINNGKVLADSTGKIFGIESDVTITSKGGWQGTAVPNSGYVENVYFNTNLSVEEVVNLLQSANLTITNENIYMLLCSTDGSLMLDIMIQDGIFGIRNQSTNEFYFHNAIDEQMVSMFGFEAGWNPNISLPINISMELIADYNGMPIGVDNDKLSTLFSTTPFVQASGESIGLSGEYDGSSIEVSESVDMRELLDNKKLPLTINIDTGVHINGVVKEYQVFGEENVNAGDFLEFVTNSYTSIYGSGSSPNCILLGNNKVFMVDSSGYSNYYLRGVIVEIDKAKMEITYKRLLSEIYSAYNAVSCVLLEENKVFIAHNYKPDQSYSSTSYIAGTIVEINGTEMTATTTVFEQEMYSSASPNCILLENNKVLITYAGTSSKYLYGTIVEIDGTTMTASTTQLKTNNCQSTPSCILLENNKVFIAYPTGSSPYLYGTIVEIDGTTMTASADKTIGGSYGGSLSPSCVLLEENKVFVARTNSSSNNLVGSIIDIDGTTMTVTTTSANQKAMSASPSCVLLEENKVFVVYVDKESTYNLTVSIFDIDGTTMTVTTTKLYALHSNTGVSAVLLENNDVFIGNIDIHYLYATLYFSTPYVKQYNKTINGIANTSGSSGETIEVYTPNE